MALRYKVERLERHGKRQAERLKEAQLTIKRLRREIVSLKQELNPVILPEGYSANWSWTNKVIFVLRTVGLPLRILDILDELQKIDSTLFKKPSPADYLSLILAQAIRQGRLLSYESKHFVGEFYALPDWSERLGIELT